MVNKLMHWWMNVWMEGGEGMGVEWRGKGWREKEGVEQGRKGGRGGGGKKGRKEGEEGTRKERKDGREEVVINYENTKHSLWKENCTKDNIWKYNKEPPETKQGAG